MSFTIVEKINYHSFSLFLFYILYKLLSFVFKVLVLAGFSAEFQSLELSKCSYMHIYLIMCPFCTDPCMLLHIINSFLVFFVLYLQKNYLYLLSLGFCVYIDLMKRPKEREMCRMQGEVSFDPQPNLFRQLVSESI
jgi:hypothetical protein